jgi:hypothetical protein
MNLMTVFMVAYLVFHAFIWIMAFILYPLAARAKWRNLGIRR